MTQLRQIHDYIAQDSPLYGKRVTKALVEKTNVLGDLPHLGHKVPELDEDTIRALSLYSYRIIYEIKPTQVVVLAVIHKRRDLQPDQIPFNGI